MILGVVAGLGVSGAFEIRIYRNDQAQLSAARRRQISDATQVHRENIATELRTNLTSEDVRFLRVNGWEPSLPQHRMLAAGVQPASGLGMKAIEPPHPPRPQVKSRGMTGREMQAWAERAFPDFGPSKHSVHRPTTEIRDASGRLVYILEENP